TATLSAAAIGERETAFELEDGLETIAQIFGALQAPAVAGLNAVIQTGLGGLDIVGLEAGVANTGIDNTIQGYGRFCLSNAGKAERKSSSEQSLFHVRNLRRCE